MGILVCENFFRDVWIRNKSVRAEIGQILHTDTHPHTHTTAAKLVVRIFMCVTHICRIINININLASVFNVYQMPTFN